MAPNDAPLLDRVLHARVEVLLRRDARDGVARLAAGLTPLVVVRADRLSELRWLGADVEPAWAAAVAEELDPAAAGLVVPGPGGTRGVALTVTAAGARAQAFAVQGGSFLRRARTVVGPELPLAGRAEQLASALCRALVRANAERLRAAAAET